MEKQFDQKESLQVIESMINASKRKISENGFGFLYWGWLVFILSLAHFILIKINYENAAMIWSVMSIAWIPYVIYYVRKEKNKKATTYIDSFMGYLWLAFGVSLIIVLIFIGRYNWAIAYPTLIILYGIGTFVSGGILKFNPLIYGGVACWIIAIVATFVTFEYQLLFLALSLLLSYIIPGHLLKASKQHV